jgi:hypothetical protein
VIVGADAGDRYDLADRVRVYDEVLAERLRRPDPVLCE